MRKVHLAGFAMLIALVVAPACGAATASVAGFVRNSAGTPQIGAEVQLLRADLTVVATVYTDAGGRFKFSSLFPGSYSVKAMGRSYLPSLRENVRVRAATVVNLTLNTLYEVMQWLPAQPRARNEQRDDWAWTLRSAANRPLLRWLEDGPLVVVTDRPGTTPKLKARLMATGQAGSFGESGERISAAVEDTPNGSRELLARIDFEPNTDGAMESMLGFRQDLGFAGSVQSVAAVTIHPEVIGPDGHGMNEATVSAWEQMHFGDEFDVEAGATQVIGRMNGESPSTAVAALPSAAVTWHGGNSSVSYRFATMVPSTLRSGDDRPQALMPAMSVRDGQLVFQRGTHQELGWNRAVGSTGMSVVFYSDTIRNPVLEARGNAATAASGQALFDNTGNLMRVAGKGFSTQGVVASLEQRLPHGNQVRLSYRNGSALVMPALPHPVTLSQVFAAARPHRTAAYSISLSGTLDGTGTKWRASYRWQPEDTVTEVAPYAMEAISPYLNVRVRQTLHSNRDGASGIEALLDVQNLLAQGNCPFHMKDGSTAVFAAQQRGIRGGLAFTF